MTSDTQPSGPPVSTERVGWIGTGRMGAAMAGRLATAGVDLQVWNRTASRLSRWPSWAHSVDSLTDLASLDVVFTDGVHRRRSGAGAHRGRRAAHCARTGAAVVVDTSTVSTETSEAMRAPALR
jgi:3-hydroxyisobutyrate dehydrogenase-like beta-hydroxyacid dehydrogenase